jgi:hypothetical protein
MMANESDDERMVLVMNACCILHNLCVRTWQDFINIDDVVRYRREDLEYRASDPAEEALGPIQNGIRRREELVDALIDLNPEGYKETVRAAERCKFNIHCIIHCSDCSRISLAFSIAASTEIPSVALLCLAMSII